MRSFTLDDEDKEAFRQLAVRFARQTIAPFLKAEYSDGDPSMIPEIIKQGMVSGLWFTPENSLGIWGDDHADATLSLELLSILAEYCAATAFLFHTNGLALRMARTALGASIDQANIALQQDPYSPPLLGEFTGNGQIKARADFTWYFTTLIHPDAPWLLFHSDNNGTNVYLTEQKPHIINEESTRFRLGLRNITLHHIRFDSPEKFQTIQCDGAELLRQGWYMHWLGIAAMGIGAARGAIKEAQHYTQQRYQGGTTIDKHDAVSDLLTQSLQKLRAAEALLNNTEWPMERISVQKMSDAMRARAEILPLCAAAVTDSLQTFGGYGYMEDFGIEKRLRDVVTLKSMAGSSIYLKRMLRETMEL